MEFTEPECGTAVNFQSDAGLRRIGIYIDSTLCDFGRGIGVGAQVFQQSSFGITPVALAECLTDRQTPILYQPGTALPRCFITAVGEISEAATYAHTDLGNESTLSGLYTHVYQLIALRFRHTGQRGRFRIFKLYVRRKVAFGRQYAFYILAQTTYQGGGNILRFGRTGKFLYMFTQQSSPRGSGRF